MSEEYIVELPLTLTLCPLCNEIMNRSGKVEVFPEEGVTYPTIDAMTQAVSTRMAEMIEEDIIVHYQRYHRVRYWLFMRTQWKWLLG